MRKIIFAFILSLVLFASCKKDWLDSEIFLCGATINGTSYKDVTTVREDLFIGVFMPFNNKIRVQIQRDTIVYLQFRLISNQEPKECFYLYGGIVFDKKGKFPLLNKVYEINYEPKFNTLWCQNVDLQHYLAERRDNGTAQLPFGVIIIENLKEPGEEISGSYSLAGTLIFDSYNPKTRQCEGHFKLSNELAEGVAQTYLVEGRFKTEIYNHNTVNN